MDQISKFTNRKFEKTKTSERAELLRFFIENLKDKQGKPYSPSFIGMKLSHLSIPDLYFLQNLCKNSNNFGMTFWYTLKTQKR